MRLMGENDLCVLRNHGLRGHISTSKDEAIRALAAELLSARRVLAAVGPVVEAWRTDRCELFGSSAQSKWSDRGMSFTALSAAYRAHEKEQADA